jgi:hypothetical protein
MPGIVCGARPRPFFGRNTQTASDRVGVNIVDLPVYRVGFEQIAIVAPAPLPEAKARPTTWLSVFHALEKIRCFAADKGHRTLGDRLFDRVENFADVINRMRRPEQDMGMFGHDTVRPQVEAVLVSGMNQRVNQPEATLILAEEWLAVKTSKR